MNITAVIPCRAGSTRVKNKNFRRFADSNLLEIKVKQAKALGRRGLDIVVNSDSPIAKDIAIANGVRFVERPEYYASSECTNSEYYEHLASGVDADCIMILQPTAPLIRPETINDCLDVFTKNGPYSHLNAYDSLMTCEYVKKFAWYGGSPMNYDLTNMPNSQDLQPIVMPTFNIMICKVDSLLKAKNVITDRCFFYEVDDLQSVEIDTPLDFEIAEFLYKKIRNEDK